MGKSDLIDSYIDEQGVKRQSDVMIGEINRVYKALKGLDEVEVSLGKVSGSRDLKNLTSEIIAAQKKLEESTVKLVAIQDQLTKAREKENESKRQGKRTTDESISATEKEAKAQLDNLKTKQQATKYETALQKELDKTNKARVKEGEHLGKLNNAYEQLKAKYAIAANTAKNLAAAKGLENKETKEAVRIAGQYYDQLLKVEKAVGQSQRQVGQYERASHALNQVIREAPAFANSFATGISAIGNNVPMLVDEFKKLRAETGSNMAAFRSLLSGFGSFTTLLPLAFLLIQSYGKEIAGLVKNLFTAKEAFDRTKESQQLFGEAMKDSSYKDAIKNVEELRVNIQLAKEGFLSKEKVTKQFNETIGKTVGKVNNLNEAEQSLIKNGNDYIRLTLLKAAANLALEKAAQKAIEVAERERAQIDDFVLDESEFGASPEALSGAYGEEERKKEQDRIAALRKQRTEQRKKAYVDEKKKEQGEYEKIYKDFQSQATDLAKKFKGGDFFGGEYDDKETKASTEDFKKGLEKQRLEMQKSLDDITRSRLEAERDSGLSIAQDEDNSFDKRLEGYRTFYNKSLELLRFNTAAEKNLIAERAGEEFRQVNEQLKAKNITATQRQDLQKTLIAIDQTAATQKLAIEAKYNRDVVKLNETSEKQIDALQKDTNAKREKDRLEAIKRQKDALMDLLDVQQSSIKTDRNRELIELNERAKAKLLTVEQYERERLAIEEKYADALDKIEIETLEKQLQLAGFTEAERGKIIERITALQLKASEQRAKTEIDNIKAIKRAEEDLAERRRKLALEIYDALVSVESARYDRDKKKNDEAIVSLNERADKEKASIEQSVTNVAERDRRLAELEANREAQQRQLEERNKQVEKKKADFEKGAALFRIALETALAVFKLKAQAAVYLGAVATAPLAAIPLAQIPWVIASGAVAAGAVAFKKFFKGKKRNEPYEGIGIVGDGGKSELHIKEDGSMVVTPNTPTFTYVSSKDTILPDANAAFKNGAAEIHKALHYSGYAKEAERWKEAALLGEIKQGISGMGKDVVKAVKSIPQPHIITEGPVQKWLKTGHTWQEHIRG